MIKIANDYYFCQVLCFNERCHANLGNGCQKTNDGQNDQLFSMVELGVIVSAAKDRLPYGMKKDKAFNFQSHNNLSVTAKSCVE